MSIDFNSEVSPGVSWCLLAFYEERCRATGPCANIVNSLNFWLRDNCTCPRCFSEATYQRLVDTYKIAEDVHPDQVTTTTNSLKIVWDDGHVSTFSSEWLQLHTKEYTAPSPKKEELYPERVLWTRDTIASNKPTVPYESVISGDHKQLLANIHSYGFSFIHGVPVTAEATEEMCNKFLPIRHTHYGGFWDFTSDLSMKDTAYSDIEIPSHTDGTYWEYTPYLQLFHLLFHDGTGGETTVVDSFKCARDFKEEFPEEYKLLSEVEVECHSLGDVHLVQRKPVLIHDKNGELIQVSWNNSDRSTNYHLDNDTLKKLYSALRKWNTVINRPENVFWQQLVPGEILIFDNWRVFHARMGTTTGKRRMCGAYFDRDDFLSSLRRFNATSEEDLYKRST